jgi:hypothetical protein
MTRVELKAFTYSIGPNSLSIDNAVLGQLPKLLLFTMNKNENFLGSLDTKPYFFQHFNISRFTLFKNGKQIPSECLAMNIDQEKNSVLGFNTLFEESGIRHSNAGYN